MTTVSQDSAEFSQALDKLVNSYVTRFTSDMKDPAKKMTSSRSSRRRVEKLTSSFVESNLKPFLHAQARLYPHHVLLAASLFHHGTVDTFFQFEEVHSTGDTSSRPTLDHHIGATGHMISGDYVSSGKDLLDTGNMMVNWMIPLAIGEVEDHLADDQEEGGGYEGDKEDGGDDTKEEDKEGHHAADNHKEYSSSSGVRDYSSSTHSARGTASGKPLFVLPPISE